MNVCVQLLQTVAVDVTTRGSLGKCLAVRVGDVLSALKSEGVETTLVRSAVEIDLLTKVCHCRRSQQKFLHNTSTDTTLKYSNRGVGGNTQSQRCIIIQQKMVDVDIVLSIRQGIG